MTDRRTDDGGLVLGSVAALSARNPKNDDVITLTGSGGAPLRLRRARALRPRRALHAVQARRRRDRAQLQHAVAGDGVLFD